MSRSLITRKLKPTPTSLRPLLAAGLILIAAIACSFGPDANPQEQELATRVAATMSAMTSATASVAAPEATPTSAETTATLTLTATLAPPSAGTSLNCDGSYQRVRVVDHGNSGRTMIVDQWTASGWQTRWEYDAGDPAIQQITDRAGAYSFGGCQQLLVLPLLFSGSGAVLDLRVFQWMGEGVVEVYSNDGTHGDWQIIGDRLRFEKSLYLFDEPNCCPCNRQMTEHQWNGSAFIEVETEIQPTYSGTPPPICQP